MDKRDGGSDTQSTYPGSIGWHRLRLVSNGTNTKAYVDDTLIFTHPTMKSFDIIQLGNKWADNSMIAYFDNLRVVNTH